jgi:hypothetical protein
VGDGGLLVDPTLAPHLVMEVLDRVRQVHHPAIEAGPLQRLVEDASRGPDERLTLTVLDVPRLLADDHHVGIPRSGREHDLRGVGPQLTAAAPGSRVS